MKRSLAIAAIALTVAATAYTQTLEGFQTAFSNFTGAMADSLALNSTIGSNWSDAYVGKFPHLGVGATVGSAFIKADSATSLFDSIAPGSLPSELKSLGIPLPAAVATFKIGLPFIPLDIGVKGGFIPTSVGENLKTSTGVAVDYTNFGLQVRYALVKQNLLLPNVSIGASYNYLKGSISAPTNIGAKSFTVATDQGSTTITASDPALALGWTSNTVDFTAQVSKLLLFVVPYAGLGYTVGSSSVTGGVSSTMITNYPGGISALNSQLASIGGPEIDDQGFTYTGKSSTPVLRLYGGLSLRIIVLDIDTQVIYVPATKALGASVTARVQL